MDEDELFVFAKQISAPFSLVQEVAKTGRLPVVNFAAGGIATPADAALMMQLGVDGEGETHEIKKKLGSLQRRHAVLTQCVGYWNSLVETVRLQRVSFAQTSDPCFFSL